MKLRAIALSASLALLSLSPGLALANTGTADQSSLHVDHWLQGSYIEAQTFTAGITGYLDSVELYLSPSPHGTVFVSIQGTTGSTPVPNGTTLASKSLAVPASSPAAWFRFYLAPNPTLVAGHVYAIVFTPTDNVTSYGGTSNPYHRGRALVFSGGSWVTPPNLASPSNIDDFAFRTWMIATATPTPTHRITARPVTAATPTPTPTAVATPTASATASAAPSDSPTAIVAGASSVATTPDPATGSGSTAGSGSGGSGGSILPLLVGAVVVLALLAGLLFLMLRRRRASAA
jgi:hypothetical protein